MPSPKSALTFAAVSVGVVFSVATSELGPAIGPEAMGDLSAVLPDEHEELLLSGASVSFPLHVVLHATAGVAASSVEVAAALEPSPLRNVFGAPSEADVVEDAGPGEDTADGDAGTDDAIPAPDVATPVFRMTIAFAGGEGTVADGVVDATTFRDMTTEILVACSGMASCDATEDLVLTFTRLDQSAGAASLFWRAGAHVSYSDVLAAPGEDTLAIEIAGPDDEVPAGDEDAGAPADDDAGV